jgi:HAT1-interacting factor 1
VEENTFLVDTLLDNQSTYSKSDAVPSAVTHESSVEQAKRAFALKKYEEAVDHYATALELV